MPVLQLRADAFPEVGYRPGTVLLQVLWCPREHARCWAKPVLYWRKREAVRDPLRDMPAEPAAYPGYVPLSCRLFPERVTDLPDGNELGPLIGKLEAWNARTRRFPGRRMEDLYVESAPYRGWKIGGWPSWIQGPEVPVCRRGHKMELLLSCASEYMGVTQAPSRNATCTPTRRIGTRRRPRTRPTAPGYGIRETAFSSRSSAGVVPIGLSRPLASARKLRPSAGADQKCLPDIRSDHQ